VSRKRINRLFALLTLAVVLISGCGGAAKNTAQPAAPAQGNAPAAAAPSLEELAKKEGKVVVFSPSKGALMDNMGIEFKKKYGIEVENIYLGSTQIINRLRAEKDNPTGDVWVGAGGIIPFLVGKKEGVLEPYKVTGYDFPEKNGEIVMRDKDNYFHGAWILTLGWAYNTQKGTPADVPANFSDFFDPKWKNQVEMADPAASGTAVLFIMSHILKYKDAGKTEDQAWADLKKFTANVKRFPESGGGPSQDVSKGDIKVGMAFDQQTYLLKAKKEPVEWVLPQNTPVVIDPAGLVAKAPHQNAAKLYLEFLASKEGQTLVANDGPYMPVRPDVPPAALFTHTLADYAKNAQKLDLDWLVNNFDAVQQRWRTEIAGGK
jgi:iron(III) transport system substrate-binding protein